MKTSLRNVAISALILVITLTLAWNEWTDTDVHQAEGVVVIEGELADLEKVVWESEKETIVMERRQDEEGEYWWVTHTTTRMVPVQSSESAAPVPRKPTPPGAAANPHTLEAKKKALEKAKEQSASPSPSVDQDAPTGAPEGSDGAKSAPDQAGGEMIPAPETPVDNKGPEDKVAVGEEAAGDASQAQAQAEDSADEANGKEAPASEDAESSKDTASNEAEESDSTTESEDKDETPKKKPAPATASPADTPKSTTPEPKREMEEKVTVTYYKAGINGEELVEKLSPMVAMRKLDSGEATFDSVCQKDKLKEVTPKATLKLTIGGKEHEVGVWCQSYGTRDWYVQKIDGGEIFLVDDEVLRTLNQAKSRLADRRLWSFKKDEIVAAVIATPPADGAQQGQQVQAEHPDAGKDDTLGWKALGKPINSDESKNVRKFMDSFLKLNGSSYRNPGEYEALGLTEAKVLQVKLATEELGEQTVTITHDGETYWAKSEHTHGSLKLVGQTPQALVDMAAVLTSTTTATEVEPEVSPAE